jgi:hypothetical protein
MQNNGKFIGWYDSQHGFIFTTAEGQRFLKSKATGFAEPDIAKETAHVGMVDWTDGKTTLTWNAAHRYSGVGFDNKLYEKNKEITLTLDGTIAGAAKKSGVFIVFDSYSSCRFISSANALIANVYVNYHGTLTQCVAISPDCTKAAFISLGENLNLVELAINVENHTVTETSITSVFPGVADLDYYLDPNLSFSKTFTLSVDFDSANNLKTWEQSVDYSKTTVVDPVLPSPSDPSYVTYWTDLGMVMTSIGEVHLFEIVITTDITVNLTLDYNGLLAGEISYSSHQTLTKYMIQVGVAHYADVGPNTGQVDIPEYYPIIVIPNYTETRDFYLISDLDLRTDLIVYTKFSEPVTRRLDSPGNSFEIHKEYWFKQGDFSTKYKADFDLAETFDSDVDPEDASNGINVPISRNLHLALMQPHLFSLAVQVGDLALVQAKNMHYDDDVLERVSVDLHDAFNNRMLKLNAVTGVIYDYTFIGFNRESNKFIKIDNTNSVKDSSAIVDIIGVI